MDTKKENIIILGIFFILLGVLAFMNMSHEKKTGKIKISNPLQAGGILGRTKTQSNPDNYQKQIFSAEEGDILSKWGRDPFEYRKNRDSSVASEQPADFINKNEPLMLSLILISSQKKIATINNRIFMEGDMVLGEKIISIESDGVVLEKNGGLRVLPLRRTSVSILTED